MTTDANLPTFHVRGFGGGLNKAVSSFKLRDDELRDCQNVRVDLKGSLKPRAGLRRYDISGAHLLPGGSGLEVKGIYRYTNSKGTRKFIIQQSQSAFVDANDGAFVAAGSVPKSPDGFARFCQWRSTVYAAGLSGVPAVYNPLFASSFADAQSHGSMNWACVFDVDVVSGSGNWTTGNSHSYRFTVDYQLDDDFLCESFPLHESATDAVYGTLIAEHQLGDNFWAATVTEVTDAAAEYRITKGTASSLWQAFQFPSQAKAVNIYRSLGVPTGTTAAGLAANDAFIGTQFYWIGSFDVASYNAASIGTVLFTDYGDPPSSGITLTSNANFERIPPARFACIYKGRLWLADVTAEIPDVYKITAFRQYDNYSSTFTTKTVNNASRVYFSRQGEPGAIGFQSWQPIRETDGEGISGMLSWKDRALFVFKPNSITGIYGGDEEIAPGIPDIAVELVDEAVGCIAPDSIAVGEGGIMFLSNRGVMFFDGTKPESMQSKLIDPILDTIQPERRQFAAGVYDNHNRKYLLAISTTDEEAGRNNVVLEYDFFTNTWTKHVYMDGSAVVFGFNQFVEMKRGDETQRLVATCDNAGAYQQSTGAVQVLDDVYYESVSFTDIAWNAKTKYFDCGEPDRIKTFMVLLVRVKTPQPMYVDYDVDEGSVTGTLTVATTANHTWNEPGLNWQGATIETIDHFWGSIVQGETALRFPQDVCGRRISFTFRGNSHLPDTEIQGFSIRFTREDREEV